MMSKKSDQRKPLFTPVDTKVSVCIGSSLDTNQQTKFTMDLDLEAQCYLAGIEEWCS